MSTDSTPWWKVRVSPFRHAVGLLLLLPAAVFFYFMLAKGMRFFVVESTSMERTLHDRDRLAAIRPASFLRGDVVIVSDPTQPGDYVVKRLIALPGDTVEVRSGALYINDAYISEPYRPEPIDYSMPPVLVEPGFMFVLGDNANHSADSHNWATLQGGRNASVDPRPVPAESVIARVFYRYYPIDRFGPVRGYPIERLMDLAPARSAQAWAIQ